MDIFKKELMKVLNYYLEEFQAKIKKGFFAKQTLFDDLKENMTIAQEEIFGPVLGVLTINSDEEALKIASNSKYGLHASVFTQDIDRAFHMAKSLPCGTVSVNTFS